VTATRHRQQHSTELLAGPAAGLDRVAVRAQGDHLGRVVRTAEGQVPHVVDLQDRVARRRPVLDVAGAAGVLAPAAAADQDGPACRRRAHRQAGRPLLPRARALVGSPAGDRVQLPVGPLQRALRQHRPGGNREGGAEQPDLGQQPDVISASAGEELRHQRPDGRDPRLLGVPDQLMHRPGQPAARLVLAEPALGDRPVRARHRIAAGVQLPQARAVQGTGRVGHPPAILPCPPVELKQLLNGPFGRVPPHHPRLATKSTPECPQQHDRLIKRRGTVRPADDEVPEEAGEPFRGEAGADLNGEAEIPEQPADGRLAAAEFTRL
jgi:hypothetical protein